VSTSFEILKNEMTVRVSGHGRSCWRSLACPHCFCEHETAAGGAPRPIWDFNCGHLSARYGFVRCGAEHDTFNTSHTHLELLIKTLHIRIHPSRLSYQGVRP